jgi:purine catabolism regulator
MSARLDIAHLLDFEPLRGARLVAGDTGVRKAVTGVRVVRSLDDLDGIGPTDLVITDLALTEAGPSTTRVIDAVTNSAIAGLVVSRSNAPRLPVALLRAADASETPVLETRDDLAPNDVAAPLLAALLDTEAGRLQRMLDIHHRFAQRVLAGGGVREIAATLHDVIRMPVLVLDPARNVVAAVPGEATPADVAGLDALSIVQQTISAGDDEYGTVVVLADAATLDDEARVAIDRTAAAIAMRHAQARAVSESQERFAAISLEELVSGHIADREELAERAAGFGWNLESPRAVLLASIDPPYRRLAPRVLGTIASAARSALGRDAIVWTRASTVAALIAPPTAAPEDRRNLALELQDELTKRVTNVTISIGVGRRVDDPLELPRSFAEASRAVDVGRWAKGRHVTEVFDDLGLERLLAACDERELRAFVHHAIGPLQEHDRVHGTELVATLDAWLDTRNVAEAARRGHVHYNTLKNRLDRIEALIGPVLTDSARLLECGVALHIVRHHEVADSFDLDHRAATDPVKS